MTKIAIIGAGLAGITAANTLKQHAEVTIFEKSRGVGGRIATRRATPYCFDHGAQFFTIRTKEFKSFCTPMIEQGIIKSWDGNFVEIENKQITQRRSWNQDNPHYVGSPSMNAIAKYISNDLNIKLETQICSISKNNKGWSLLDIKQNTQGEYDWVIIAAPIKQAQDLLNTSSLSRPLSSSPEIEQITMQGCFSLMLGFKEPLSIGFDAALVKNENISWISVNSSKPDRNKEFSLLIHSTNNWADQHIDDDRQQVLEYLCNHSSEIVGHDLTKAIHKDIHGWRYANIGKQRGNKFLINKETNIAMCGDWFIQGRIEAAFISGNELAKKIVSQIK